MDEFAGQLRGNIEFLHDLVEIAADHGLDSKPLRGRLTYAVELHTAAIQAADDPEKIKDLLAEEEEGGDNGQPVVVNISKRDRDPLTVV